MTKFTIHATRTTTFSDEVEADTLEEAMKIVDEWIAEDFTEVGNRWDIKVA